jgi:hypothetical protein
METKAANIEKAQDNKAENIKISSTMRDAVLITVSEAQHDATVDYGERIKYWRAWLWKQWDDTSGLPPF